MTFVISDPGMQFDNPLYRLWKFVEDCERRYPNTDACARYMDMDRDTVRPLLQRLQREGYLSSEINHRQGRRSRGREPSTWRCREWTLAMMVRPFPKPRGWKPPVYS